MVALPNTGGNHWEERGSRFKAFIRGANQRDQPFNIKKTWRCCVHDVVLQRLYHMIAPRWNPFGSKKNCKKLIQNLWLMRRRTEWHFKLTDIPHYRKCGEFANYQIGTFQYYHKILLESTIVDLNYLLNYLFLLVWSFCTFPVAFDQCMMMTSCCSSLVA